MMRRVLHSNGLSWPAASRCMTTASEGSVVDNLREAAGKVQAKVSEMFQGTKQFVGEATERVKADGETYAGAIKEQASKAKDAASASELGERAAAAAAEGNAAAVDAAIGGQAGSHDVATGIRGPGVVAERMDLKQAVPENQKLPRSFSAMEVEAAFKLAM
ncbi:hypothetical protein QJQ45_018794 [Haematococcus lacustris]|nr:hypothetical protein QJQ45_018794 [Haematococcus lacustris]